MVADIRALRRVPARFFGVFMSVNPVFAALTRLIVLGQSLEPADWLAIAAMVAANAIGVSTGGRARGPGQTDPHEATMNDPGMHSAFPVQGCDALNMQPRRGDLSK